jgi:dihydroflavonol-4-reductase
MNSGDSILVTGASGFVGSAVLRALGGRGLKLRALARVTSPRSNFEGVDCEIVEGDMTDPVAMNHALAGVRHLYHVAADYRLWARDPGDIIRANVEGTRTVMEAALSQGVERIVYTSSVATLRAADASISIDETAPLGDGEAIGAYKQSKVAAERLVEEMSATRGLPAVIVLPSTPIGPGDIKPTPTGRIVIEAATGRIPAFVDTGLNLVHVDDVAAGHLMAMEKGAPGERYILGGQNASLRELLWAIAELVGRRPPTVNLPRTPLYPLAWAAEAAARLTGKEPFVTRDALKMASHHMFFTSAKAERDLGYMARPYREALADAIAWFRATGRLA